MKRKKYNNVLIVAGTGRNSGKTRLACMIITRFRNLSPVGIKISPHFHEPAGGLLSWQLSDKFNIYVETGQGGRKDTERMLESGAYPVYYIQARDKDVKEAFGIVIKKVESTVPVICESPSLAGCIDPGVLFITDSGEVHKKKEIDDLFARADRVFDAPADKEDFDKLGFSGGNWIFR